MLSRTIRVVLLFVAVTLTSSTAIVYIQPPHPSGGLYPSSRWNVNDSDYDKYVWDGFVLGSTQGITEVRWRGGYNPATLGAGGSVVDFTVAIYPSITGGSQPAVANPPLVEYQTGGNAAETQAGMVGGVAMYDYQFTLPTPFTATAGTKYWVQIEAWQHGSPPDWGIATGTGGDSHYFRRFASMSDITFQIVTGAAAFTLLAPPSNTFRVYLPLSHR